MSQWGEIRTDCSFVVDASATGAVPVSTGKGSVNTMRRFSTFAAKRRGSEVKEASGDHINLYHFQIFEYRIANICHLGLA